MILTSTWPTTAFDGALMSNLSLIAQPEIKLVKGTYALPSRSSFFYASPTSVPIIGALSSKKMISSFSFSKYLMALASKSTSYDYVSLNLGLVVLPL